MPEPPREERPQRRVRTRDRYLAWDRSVWDKAGIVVAIAAALVGAYATIRDQVSEPPQAEPQSVIDPQELWLDPITLQWRLRE